MCIISAHADDDEDRDDEELFPMDAEDATAKITDPAQQSVSTKDAEAHRLAESWRAGITGRFRRDEVNLTKIGAFSTGSFLFLVQSIQN